MEITIQLTTTSQNGQSTPKEYVNFERFSFDIVSLWGEQLLDLTIDEYDLVLREVFKSVTYKDGNMLRLLDISVVNTYWQNRNVKDFFIPKVSVTQHDSRMILKS